MKKHSKITVLLLLFCLSYMIGIVYSVKSVEIKSITTNFDMQTNLVDNRDLNPAIFPNYQNSSIYRNADYDFNRNETMSLSENKPFYNDFSDFTNESSGNIISQKVVYQNQSLFYLYDNDASGKIKFSKSFTTQTSGIIEFLIAITTDKYTYFALTETSLLRFYLTISSNGVYLNGKDYGISININQIYHFQLEFSSNTDTFNLTIDGKREIINYPFYSSASGIDGCYIDTELTQANVVSYFGKLGFSWDSGYNVRNAVYERYESIPDIADYKMNKTGVIQWGTAANPDLSQITQGDVDAITVVDYEGHKNVLRIDEKESEVDKCYISFEQQSNGIIEFKVDENAGKGGLRVYSSEIGYFIIYITVTSTQISVTYGDGAGGYLWKYDYQTGMRHIRIEFDCSTDKFSLWVNSIQLVNNLNFHYDRKVNYADRFYFGGESNSLTTEMYLDALGFSWDGYTPRTLLWTPSNDASCSTIVNDLSGRSRVIDMYDNNAMGLAKLSTTFSTQITGIEILYFMISDASKNGEIRFGDSVGDNRIWMRVCNNKIQYFYSGGWHNASITILSNVWYECKINFNCETDTYDVYINDVLLDSNISFAVSSLGLFSNTLNTDVGYSNYHFYVDVLYCSWQTNLKGANEFLYEDYYELDNPTSDLLVEFEISDNYEWECNGYDQYNQQIVGLLYNTTHLSFWNWSDAIELYEISEFNYIGLNLSDTYNCIMIYADFQYLGNFSVSFSPSDLYAVGVYRSNLSCSYNVKTFSTVSKLYGSNEYDTLYWEDIRYANWYDESIHLGYGSLGINQTTMNDKNYGNISVNAFRYDYKNLVSYSFDIADGGIYNISVIGRMETGRLTVLLTDLTYAYAWVSVENNNMVLYSNDGYFNSSYTTKSITQFTEFHLELILDGNTLTANYRDINGSNLQTLSKSYLNPNYPGNPYFMIMFDSENNFTDQSAYIYAVDIGNVNVYGSEYSYDSILESYNPYDRAFNNFDYYEYGYRDYLNEFFNISESYDNEWNITINRTETLFREANYNDIPYYVNTLRLESGYSQSTYNFTSNDIINSSNFVFGCEISWEDMENQFNTVRLWLGNDYYLDIQKFPGYGADIYFATPNIPTIAWQHILDSVEYRNSNAFAYFTAQDNQTLTLYYGVGKNYYTKTFDWVNFTGNHTVISVYNGLRTGGGGWLEQNDYYIDMLSILMENGTSYWDSLNYDNRIQPDNPRIEYYTSLNYSWDIPRASYLVGTNYWFMINMITESDNRVNNGTFSDWAMSYIFENATKPVIFGQSQAWEGSDIFSFWSHDNYTANATQYYEIWNYQNIDYQTSIRFDILWYFYHIPPEPTFIDTMISFIAPVSYILIFPFVFSRRWGAKGFAMGLVFSAILFGIAGTLPTIWSIILTIIAVILSVMVFKYTGSRLD